MTNPPLHRFHCNICGRDVETRAPLLREGGACPSCGSNVRFRSLMQAMSQRLFDKVYDLDAIPAEGKALRGMGMSDAPHYAGKLERAFNYTNYYYHTEPFMDITKPDPLLYGSFDFVISTDVFEHVPPPRWTPYQETWKLLKPGGLLVFSVPYTELPKTAEWFPDLHHYVTLHCGDEYYLLNEKKDGGLEIFRKLTWHGGPGDTLELRVYSGAHVRWLLEQCGFVDIRFHGEDIPEYGIGIAHHGMSYMITARKGPEKGPVDAAADQAFVYPWGQHEKHGLLNLPERVTDIGVVDVVRKAAQHQSNAAGGWMHEYQTALGELARLKRTLSWRVTAPLRAIRRRMG